MALNQVNTSKEKTALRVAQISGGFCLLVSILLILNFVQMHTANPVESQAIEQLFERLKSEPNNEVLMQEIRQLDLLARRAYFASIWAVKVGGYLLLLGGIVLIIALRLYYRFTFSIPKPSTDETDEIDHKALTIKWLIGIGASIMITAFIMAVTATDPFEVKVEAAKDAPKSTIEVVQIVDTTDDTKEEHLTDKEATEPIDTAQEEPEERVAVAPSFPTEEQINQQHNAFRGPWGNGISYSSNIPLEWDATTGKNIRWTVEVPIHGYSSPVIWDDKLFLTGATTQKREVLCYNRHNGELLWRRVVDNITGSPATPPKTTDDTGLAAPTPTTDGERVYAIFGTGDVIAFDMEGNRLWGRNLGVPDNHYGHSSSLLVLEDQLFVQYDDRNRARAIALNVLDGSTEWEVTRDSDISWASPMLAKVDGKFQLVLKGNPIVTGHSIEDGTQLWSTRCMSGEVGPSPTYGNGLVYAANEYARMVAIDPRTGNIEWETNYYLPEVSSPVVKDDMLFISTTYALVACFDALTGEIVWEFDTQNGFYSSPIIIGDLLYVGDRDGVMYILEASRELKEIAQNPLGEGIYTTPAFADGVIYIRGKDKLYCIGE